MLRWPIRSALAGIVWFRDLTGASESQGVAAPDDTIQSATAVAFSSAGHSLLVASPAGQTVTALDLADGTRTAIGCACAPTNLAAVGNLFRLNEFGGDPLWLLDTQQGPGADGLRASRAGTRLGTRPSTSIWDPTAPHPLGIRVRTE